MEPGRHTSSAVSSASASPVSSPRTRRPMTTTTDEILYTQPASVHFGGFELWRSVQQRIRVRNNSAKAIRLRYTFPTGKKGFRATFAKVDRPSFVSAGLCEEILVSFTPPTGFQYYYDCIQVQCEEVAYGSNTDVTRSGSTLIPLHAYPMVNEVAFPTRLDFGVVARGTCARKFLDITCSVPVEFEYELRVTKPHPAFTVFPLTGSIPPTGEACIELEYRPLQYATASAELELHVSQLGFVPRICTLVGSSSSTAVGGSTTVEVAQLKGGSPASPAGKERSGRQTAEQAKISKASTPRTETKTRRKEYAKEEPQSDEVNEREGLEKVRGIEIPHNLNSVTGVTFVLNQESGKLKPKDLKKAIARNRALQQQQREEQAKLSTGKAPDDQDEDAATLNFHALVQEEEGYLERTRVGKQVKDMFFLHELREVAEAEKTLEFQSHKVHLGQRLLSSKQVDYLAKLREKNSRVLTNQQREQLRTMFINVLYDPPVVCDQKNDNNQLLLLGELKTAVLPAHFIPAYTPDFKPYKNDLWARRQRLLRRLVRAVSTCMLRLRAQKRLNRIHAWLDGSKTRAQVREKVALDWQSSTQTGCIAVPEAEKYNVSMQKAIQKSNESVSNDDSSRNYLSSFPIIEESTTQKHRESIDVPADWGLKFTSFTFMELKPRDESLLMGHEPFPLPALPTYVPLQHTRLLRQGAKDEIGVLDSLLLQSPASKVDVFSTNDTSIDQTLSGSAPSMLEMLPSDIFQRPQASVRPLQELQGQRETESSYALRPRRVFRTFPTYFMAWQNSQIGLQSVTGSHDGVKLYLSDAFLSSTDRKQVEPVFPFATEFSITANGSMFGDAWNLDYNTVPPLAKRADDIPSLSDSESDEDGGTGEAHISWKHALELFEDPSAGLNDDKPSSIFEDGELFGCEKGVFSFQRYRHLIRQERAYNIHRQKLFERLPELLPVAPKISVIWDKWSDLCEDVG
ncbi:uncharacterized protein PITG_19267 [Phytophthora infestans T30-4]|uniref:Primary ciliary dyskinesia protein 1 n=1 Tax=Phytophthora infestans (strain T30-4) TaxID=403677 RepID=D0NZK4_PHYIT|nr:uncharacterized protein PITG_19267 [Phytophthora infestans T30-4]EEY69563.1 conserved hypothetical protein [Phytophthora infestans T30-4]|eukprot:XP_002997201.1 conserved hypothetical protein [Phytophthora infestans T30-4]